MAEVFTRAHRTTVDTTDGTKTQAATFATRDNNAYHITATIVATETADYDEVASYVRHATFKNDGGTLSKVGSTTDAHTAEDTAGWDVEVVADGTNIDINVTGAASTNITWMVDHFIMEVGNATND